VTDLDAWRAKVDAPKLTTEIEDGLVVEPLYAAAPAAPAGRGHATPWTVGHEYAGRDPGAVAAAIEMDRRFGLATAWIRVDAGLRARARVPDDAPKGTVLRSAAQARRILDAAGDDVVAMIDAGADGTRVLGVVREAGADAARVRVLLDPLGAWVELGGLGIPVDEALRELGGSASVTPDLTELLASGLPYHDAGATPAVEIAATLGTAVAYVRAAALQGEHVDRACARLVLRLAVDSDVFVSIAKLRAARWLWRGVARRFGATATPRVSIRTALRNRTRHDPRVNMLRATVETFAAAAGGADEIVVGAFDETIGRPSDDGRRWAILGQHVLREESELAIVDDPAAGCGYVESLTEQLAEQAWAFVREIEAAGGMALALDRGLVQTRVRDAAHKRRQLLARSRITLVGVSLYPDLDEPREQPQPDPGLPEGADTLPEPVAKLSRLPATRLAEPFEALRDASDAHLARTGARPLAVLVAIGSASEHRARVDFARSAVTVGGFAPQVVDEQHLVAAPLGVICGSDERLATDASRVATAMRSAGVRQILVTSQPAEYEHVDGFLHRGTEILSTMSDLQTTLEGGA
jgi:methylmalonyl-CoA mutase